MPNGSWTNINEGDELAQWVDDNTQKNAKITRKHINRVVWHILGAQPEGGSAPQTGNGETVYHDTSFDKGPREGCTIFYTNPDRQGQAGTIVGIGIHLGSDSYELAYIRAGVWNVPKRLQL
jgi:hypothetical protein